jgi:hypothetical protein
MHKRLKILINNVKEIFSIEFLNRLSKKTGFVKRKSKLNAETFLAFNTFSSDDLCDKSLSTLCARLAAQYNISISPQALNERFNKRSVAFMQEVFNAMMIKQNNILNQENKNLSFRHYQKNNKSKFIKI